MPSYEHEFLIELFRSDLDLAPELLRSTLGVDVPDHTETSLENCDLTDIDPTEYRADVTISLRTREGVKMAIIVEVQRGRDGHKRLSWPVYVTTLRARLDCPTVLMVLCPEQSTAEWCAQTIAIGHPGMVLKPLVIGPERTPVVADPAQATQHPELAVLSACAHGDDPGVLDAFGHALDALDSEKLTLYHDYVFGRLSDLARRHWEKLMTTRTYEWQSDIARKYVAEGEAKGLAAGKAEGLAEAVLVVLDNRGVPVSEAARERITTCADLEQLQAWAGQAVGVDTVDELFS